MNALYIPDHVVEARSDLVPIYPLQSVDGPYNKLLTVNISTTVALYNEIHACFRC
jgi:hypothetical protein